MLVGLYAAIPTMIEYSSFSDINLIPSQFHAALSLVLGWLLVFRTNTAYSRWWEARTLWGALVNASRNLALKLNTLGKFSVEELSKSAELIVAFPVVLRCHLRDEISSGLPNEFRPLVMQASHAPQAVVGQLYEILGTVKASGRIDGDEMRALDEELRRLMDICGGCERILRTRIVTSYRVFARQCVILFLATLPWGIVHDFRVWTIPLTIITAYFMLGLETVAEHVEEPFGYDEDDLALESLCETIAMSVRETFALRSLATREE